MAYSEQFKANALVTLAAHGGDLDTAAEAIGISTSTLWRWSKGQQVKSKKKEMVSKNESEIETEFYVEDGIKAAIAHLLSNIPVMKGNDWAVAVGILLDKWLILQNQPTERIESIFGQLGNLSPEAYEDILAEAERIIEGGGGSHTGV